MKKKINKFLFMVLLSVAMVVSAGIFSFSNNYKTAYASDNNGGGFYVGNNSVFNFTHGSISGMTATNGGGVYVANGGTFNMSGGSIFGNKATNNGDSIYNNGTFIMTGGTIGETESVGWIYCNEGSTTKIYGGTVLDNFYMYSNLQTKVGATIDGKIELSDSNKITVEDYAGTTPTYKIKLNASRNAGTIVTFLGNKTTSPDISKFTVTGYSSDYDIVIRKNSNGYFELALTTIELPSDWQTEIASTTYMTTTVTPANITKIQFVASVPSGYTKIGTLSTGLPVYKGTIATEIAFVAKSIFAPENSSQLFYNLSKLTTLDMSVFYTSQVTNMGYMFSYCYNLTSLNVSNFNTTKVTNMSFMFYNCKSLTSLDLRSFDTTNVTNMGSMFNNCSSLTSLDVGSFNTTKVTDMNYMFSSCSSLTSLDLSNFNTSQVTNMGSMFSNCSSLTSLDVSSFNTTKVEYMSYMFSNCSKLTGLNLSNFNTTKVTDMDSMFSNCSGLTSLDVSSFNTTKVTNMSNMFCSCSKLTGLNLSNFNTSNVTDMSSMFDSCSNLTSLDLSNFSTSNVTYMGYMFNDCSSLTSLDLSNFNTSQVTDMGYMFNYCSSLTSLDLSNFNTSQVTNMGYMFKYCSSLNSLDLSSFSMSKVTFSSNMLNFGTSAALKYIKTPYKNSTAIAITTGSTLYNVSTETVATGVLANSTSSQTLSIRFTLNLDANGGSCSVSSLVAYYYCSLTNVGKSLPTATQSGYTFSGWYTERTGGTRIYDSTTLQYTTTTTLYAHWTENTPTPDPDPDPPTPPDPDPDPPSPDPPDPTPGDGSIEVVEYLIFTTRDSVPSGLSKNNTFNYTRTNGNTFFEDGCTPTVYTNESGTQVAFVGNSGELVAPTDCSNLFAGMISLKWVIFRNYDTYDVTNMTSMFEGCDSLEFMEMLSIQTPNVTSMNSMFKDCSSLRQIAFAEFDCISLESASNMFYNCSSLGNNPLYSGHIRTGEIIGSIPNIKYTYNLANAEYMFAGCGWDTFVMQYMFTNSLSNTNGMFENTNFRILDLSQFIAKASDMEDIWGTGSCNVEAIYTPRYCNPNAFINVSNYYLASGSEPGVFSNHGYTSVPFSLCFVRDDKINDYEQCTFHLTINGWSDGDLSDMIDRLINDNVIFSGSRDNFSFSTYKPLADVYYLLPMPIAEYDENGDEGNFAGWIIGDGSVDPNQGVDRFSDSDFFKRWGWMNSSFDSDVYLQSIAWSDTTAQCINNVMGGTINVGGTTPYNDFYNNDRYVLSLVRYLPSVHYSDGSIFTGWYFVNDGSEISYYTNIVIGNSSDGIASGKRSADSYEQYFSFPSESSSFKANKTASEKEMQELLKLYNESKQTVLIPEDKKVTITELKIDKIA